MAAAQGNRARAAGDTDAALWGGTTMTVAGVQVLISHDDLAGVLPTPPLAHRYTTTRRQPSPLNVRPRAIPHLRPP